MIYGYIYFTCWRHQMETFSALQALYVGNSPVAGEFPSQRPVTRSFDVFFDLRLNERLSKQPWGWWFATPSRPLWRHSNEQCHYTFYPRGVMRDICARGSTLVTTRQQRTNPIVSKKICCDVPRGWSIESKREQERKQEIEIKREIELQGTPVRERYQMRSKKRNGNEGEQETAGEREYTCEKERILTWCCYWWGLLSQFSPFRYFPKFSSLWKHTLTIEVHVYIWQVSPQLSCGDTCQIWMWFKESNKHFCKIEYFAYGEINERSFSNPHHSLSSRVLAEH